MGWTPTWRDLKRPWAGFLNIHEGCPTFCRVTAYDVALLILRVCLGVTMASHGYNEFFGEGGLSGTTGWFDGAC